MNVDIKDSPTLPLPTTYGDRLLGYIRRYPKLAAVCNALHLGWTKLVDSFCTVIDPFLSRHFPDTRLVATMTKDNQLELHKICRGAANYLGILTTIGAPEKAQIAQVKWNSIELRIPPDQLLRRTLSLPVASRDFLGPIIQHRLERLVPWPPDRALYGYQTLAEVDSAARIDVLLIATSTDLVAAPLQTMRDAGLSVTAIGAQGDTTTAPLEVNLLRDLGKSTRIDARRKVSRIALISSGFLVVAYLASLIWAAKESADQTRVATQLLDARRHLNAAAIGAADDREQAFLNAKQPDKAIVILIDKLANAIPADTYLRELAVTSDKVRLAGISGNAPALVRETEAAGLFNVRFSSALTRGKDERDSFEITADRAVSRMGQTP